MRAITIQTAVEERPVPSYEVFLRYLELTKPRITMMVLVTTFVGFYLALPGFSRIILLLDAMLGTALVASGASALNMVLEWQADSRMRRTQRRPIPSGRLAAEQGYAFGMAMCMFGIFYLWLFVNLLTSVLAVITAGLYLYAYTPLKKSTRFCTIVGAIPGAIPPVMGWTAATSSLNWEAFWLFSVLFFWQLPHFYAIGWMYREDYARAGFVVLPATDPEGIRTGRQVLLQASLLVAVSVFPLFNPSGSIAFIATLILGLGFLVAAARFAHSRSVESARHLMLASLSYLPILLIFVILDKTH
jgi:protoheme IX farnesyltransferase